MKKRIYLIVILGIILDQITKAFATVYLDNIVLIKDFLSLTYVENYGGAWGILNNNLFILVGVSIITLIIINRYISSDVNITKLSMVSYGLLIGGIFGNLFDRIFRGYVVDFLNFYIFKYDFPVFNVADMLIVIGIILMFIEIVGGKYGSKSNKK